MRHLSTYTVSLQFARLKSRRFSGVVRVLVCINAVRQKRPAWHPKVGPQLSTQTSVARTK